MLIFYTIKCSYRRHECTQEICWPNLAVDDFSELFLHSSVFLVLIKLEYLSVFGRQCNTTKIAIFTYLFYEIEV